MSFSDITGNIPMITFKKFSEDEYGIQFWMIESELEQSVGRARLLREDCTVYLFSDFLLHQSNIKQIQNQNFSTIRK